MLNYVLHVLFDDIRMDTLPAWVLAFTLNTVNVSFYSVISNYEIGSVLKDIGNKKLALVLPKQEKAEVTLLGSQWHC